MTVQCTVYSVTCTLKVSHKGMNLDYETCSFIYACPPWQHKFVTLVHVSYTLGALTFDIEALFTAKGTISNIHIYSRYMEGNENFLDMGYRLCGIWSVDKIQRTKSVGTLHVYLEVTSTISIWIWFLGHFGHGILDIVASYVNTALYFSNFVTKSLDVDTIFP